MYIITGANGFIGSVMVWQLNQLGIKDILCVDEVGTDQRSGPLKNRDIKRFLLKDEFLRELEKLDPQQIKWIIHMGACSSTTERNKDYLWSTNVEYSQRIFTWCAKKNVPLIYASSAATYGDGELGFDDRIDPLIYRPLNLYGESKWEFDNWALRQTIVPPHWYALKFFNVYGPNEYHKGAMSSVAYKAYHQIREKSQLGLFRSYNHHYGDGEQMRDFIYVKDVTRWMWELTERQPANGLYNMGFGKARTWRDLSRAVFAAMSLPEKIDWLEMPESLKNQYQYFTEANMQKWFAQGLSQPKWSLEDGIKDYVQNSLMKEDPWL